MQSSLARSDQNDWLELADAARFLGVHFTTLRRWANNGKIPCMRTPGGRRRFLRADLERFLTDARGSTAGKAPLPASDADSANILVRQQLHRHAVEKEHWLGSLSEMQRMRFKYSGQMMMGLLMQYNSRSQGGDAFLKEAERMSSDYGAVCRETGMSITDTARAFLFFRHSITDMIFDTSALEGPHDEETRRLFQRTSQFFDALLLAVLEGFVRSSQASTLHTPQGHDLHASDPDPKIRS